MIGSSLAAFTILLTIMPLPLGLRLTDHMSLSHALSRVAVTCRCHVCCHMSLSHVDDITLATNPAYEDNLRHLTITWATLRTEADHTSLMRCVYTPPHCAVPLYGVCSASCPCAPPSRHHASIPPSRHYDHHAYPLRTMSFCGNFPAPCPTCLLLYHLRHPLCATPM